MYEWYINRLESGNYQTPLIIWYEIYVIGFDAYPLLYWAWLYPPLQI